MAVTSEAELFKGGVHLCVFGLAAMCFGYALMTLSHKPQRHSAVNAVVYGSLIAFEMRQINHHLSKLYLE